MTPSALVLGLIVGMTYGILAVGLVLAFRTSRIVNFAHGEVGAIAATVLALLAEDGGDAYWIAFGLGLLASAGAGAAIEAGVVRRLRRAPRVVATVATLGAAQLILFISLALGGDSLSDVTTFPEPPGFPRFHVGALLVGRAHSGILFLTPLVVISLALFLKRTRLGIAIRASADDPEAASTSGIPARTMSTLAWAIGGAISGYTAMLVLPALAFVPSTSGPALLLRALAAAVVSGMYGLPGAFVAGVGLGVLEIALDLGTEWNGAVEVLLFLMTITALALRRRPRLRRETGGAWLAVEPWTPLTDDDRRRWFVRNLGNILAVGGVVIAFSLPLLVSNSDSLVLVFVAASGLAALSVGILIGLSGQLSLGQFALAGIGAAVSTLVTLRTGNFVAGLLLAGGAGAAGCVALGLAGLRGGVMGLSVATLAFAVMAQAWLFRQPWMFGDGLDPGRPIVAGRALDTGKTYYLFAIAVVLLALWLGRNLRAGGWGRVLRAVRDNVDAARSFGIHVTGRRVQALAVAGFLAGIAGAVYGHALSEIGGPTFDPRVGISLVAMAAIGGMGTTIGPVIGTLYIIGLPSFVPLEFGWLAASWAGWLILILFAPAGFPQLIRPLRAAILRILVRRDPREDVADAEAPAISPIRLRPQSERRASAEIILEAAGLEKRFEAISALSHVSLEVRSGEIVGIIGPNGAGKTTLLDVISGFEPMQAGTVAFDGRDVTRFRPEERARLGLVRSFQYATLFPTLTVLESVRLSLERQRPSRLYESMLSLSREERAKQKRARELVDLMGLNRYRNHRIADLSTGTRRIVELTCMLGLSPRALLLDEPSSGIAEREIEPLSEILRAVRDETGAALVLVEHHMPLVMGLSDRVLALDAGRVVRVGTPRDVQDDPDVIAAFQGRPRAVHDDR